MSDTIELIRPLRTGKRYANPGESGDRNWRHVLRWKLTGKPTPWPLHISLQPVKAPAAPARGVRVTWVGQSTFLIQFPNYTLLTDPVWSDRIGPFDGRIGVRRKHAPGVTWESLPPIDMVLLSHDHYDHCDLPTLRRIAQRWTSTQLITPSGYPALARRAGFTSSRHRELTWWESHEPLKGMTLTGTPARHWSNRLSGGRNQRHWGGYHLRAADGTTVVFIGDTAYDDVMFRQIHAHLGRPDLALIPIGAYEPRWFMKTQHCDPAEAVKIHQELGAQKSVGMHWGTFPLTDEGHDTPREELTNAVIAAGLPADAFEAPDPGTIIQV